MARGKNGEGPGIATRVVEAARYVITEVKPSSWLSPGQPLTPNAPKGTKPFAWDMPVGFNMQMAPRPKSRVSHAECWQLVENCDLLRIIIERRKDQLESMPWQIKPREDTKVRPDDPRIKEVQNFLRYPDKNLDWNRWLRALLDDLFVTDAVAIEKVRDLKGRLYSLDLIPGDSITLKADPTGRLPPPPNPAFQQFYKGSIVGNFTTDEMIYAPRNVSTRDIYGLSPVQWIYTTVRTAIERAQTQLSHYTDGNLNKGIFWIDPSVSAEQMAALRDWWNALTTGNTAARQQAAFLPGKPGSFQPIVDAALKDQFDEWLARIICFAFSISPTPFVQQVNRATAETAKQAALEEGLGPLQAHIKSLMDRVIFHDFGYDDIEFAWKSDAEQDPLVAAQIRKSDVTGGIITIDEARADIGRDPFGGAASRPGIITGAGFVALPSEEALDAQDDAAVAGSNAATDLANSPDPVYDDEEGEPEKALGKKYSDPLAKPKAKAAVTAIHKRVLTALHHTAQHTAAQLRGMHVMGKADEDEKEAARKRAGEVVDQLSLLDINDIKAISGALSDAALEATEATLADAGIALVNTSLFGQVNQDAVAWASQHAAELVTQIEETTRDQLRALIATRTAAGDDLTQIASQISGTYAFSADRAKLIANTEAAFASGQGSLDGYRAANQLGLKVKKQWLDDPLACDICKVNADAGPIGINDLFPSGAMTTPQHPRCSCTTIAVFED
ncbi:phage portal protein [Roseicella sp. DB1501]|uniref:phage portal protein n=1 Tax=Roseicella sp. DB1501 TaxID=2730925 RepID=UPI001492ACE2|nr:phage portal protein [Roseicella sp. DB1501]NOG73765.1 phage portal protein [Roseicella sp. DB1501]